MERLSSKTLEEVLRIELLLVSYVMRKDEDCMDDFLFLLQDVYR